MTIHVLLVEDDAATALLVRQSLVDLTGVNVALTHVARLADAIARVHEEKFDVVLLDLALPDSTGVQTFVRWRNADLVVPVLALAGREDEGLALEAMRRGAQDCLIKSELDPASLGRSITYAIERHRIADKARAESSDRAKSEFLADLSHQLRTPLNSVIGFSELLVDEKVGALNPEQREYLNDILASGRHLLDLMIDIVDLTRQKDDLLARERAARIEVAHAREREDEISFRIQQTMLIDQPPEDFPGVRIGALSVPSQRIDGDFYIFMNHRNRSLDVIVGDVMGKGTPAALLAAATKSHFLKALSDLMASSKDKQLPEPKEVAMSAHASVVRHLIDLESFVTLCYARLNLNTRTLDFVDCGHTGVLQWHRDTGLCETHHGSDLPMGVREGETYDQRSVGFEPGDPFLLYSDGITEARSPAGEMFGAKRLEDFVRSNAQLGAAFVEAMRSTVLRFAQSDRLSDDLTCVAIKPAPALARADIEISSDLNQLRCARGFVRKFCRQAPDPLLDEDRVGALELAVTEAVSNIIMHAYDRRADQRIHLEAEAFPGCVSITLHHMGKAFDPSPPSSLPHASRESGFGVYLNDQNVDGVRYYRDKLGRNCIALFKYCKP